MDTLALLCNLHADGPATLQRLRRSGCETLVALGRIPPTELAARLDWTERSAERFLREAALLAERVEPDDERGSESDEPEFELESELVQELDGDSDESEHEDEADALVELDDEPAAAAAAPAPDRVEALLGAWRELDRVAPPSDPSDFVIPRREPPPDRELTGLDSAGLPEALLARLAQLGIRTLRELAGASTLELVRALPAGFTRVKHYQYLAERALGRHATSAPAARVDAPVQSFTPPSAEPFETAGPFA
jgi:hypothetical protein